jgi:hypothetical protein
MARPSAHFLLGRDQEPGRTLAVALAAEMGTRSRAHRSFVTC